MDRDYSWYSKRYFILCRFEKIDFHFMFLLSVSVSMEGFKIFNSDWTCLKTQYILGDTHHYKEKIEMCKSGFHFCQRALDCLNYYDLAPNNKYARVKAYDQIMTEHD